MAVATDAKGQVHTNLDANALGLPEVLMQSITSVAPAIGMLFSLAFVASLAGINAPLAYLIAAFVALGQSVSTAQLARFLPSSGGYYTYVSRGLHARAGFLTSWIYLFFLICPGATIPYFGYILQQQLQSQYGINFPWWVFFLIIVVLMAAVMYSGVKFTGRTVLILGLLEVAAVLVLSLWGIFAPGPGGFNFQPYNIGNIHDVHAFYLAVVFSIFAISGWEAAAPLAEETRAPRRIVPQALVGSVILMMVFFVICSWGLVVGWGTNDITGLAGSSTLPAFVLGHRFWGSLWIIILLALLNSTFAVCLACGNASTRVLFGMGRSGSLPKILTRIHPRTKTPVVAVTVLIAFTLLWGILVSIWIGPDQIWFQEGIIFTPVLVAVYGMGNLAVIGYFWRERKGEFNIFLHAIVPLVVTAALLLLMYLSVVPLPSAPLVYGFYIFAIWAVLGVLVLIYFRAAGREDWLLRATRSAEEIAASGEPLAVATGGSGTTT
jgi:amino acid transporter